MCLFHPTRVGAVAGVCTPYTPPWQKYLSLEELVERLPQFSYQLFLASPAAAMVTGHTLAIDGGFLAQ